jgi:glycerate kinase
LRLLIIPDKFKGTLTASAAAKAIASGWRSVRPGDALDLFPMSDGGDGFGEVMSHLLGAKIRSAKTTDAAHRRCVAKWYWEPKQRTAVVESANVIGLAMLPRGRFHPFELDTMGLGEVIQTLAKCQPRRCWLGIGGSATNDGGFGMARALGWRFLDCEGNDIKDWIGLDCLRQIIPPKRRKWFKEFLVAMDVKNPLLGAHGATRVYGPQKGLRANDFQRAEACLARLASVVSEEFRMDAGRIPGAGAAGGLGFGLKVFAQAELVPGFELFAKQSRVAAHIESADLVITGEGAIDRSTIMGKGVGEIARLSRKYQKPCIGLAGTAEPSRQIGSSFTRLLTLDAMTTLERAKADAAKWLELLAKHAADELRLE